MRLNFLCKYALPQHDCLLVNTRVGTLIVATIYLKLDS